MGLAGCMSLKDLAGFKEDVDETKWKIAIYELCVDISVGELREHINTPELKNAYNVICGKKDLFPEDATDQDEQ